MELPHEGSRERGIVRRLEPYGAFVELERFPRLRGLVHISEMAEYRVEKPEDVVSCEDVVWVRVLSAKSEEVDGRVRHRIQLSMKDADNNNVLSSSRPRSQATQQLESNLSSTIGMGFAKDPMSHLIMKHEHRGTTVINGYALVDADEGEPERPQVKHAPHLPTELGRGSTLPAWRTTENGARSRGLSNEGPRPMGRGRGATLPAWMTRGDGPGAGEEVKRSEDSNHEKDHRKEKKKHSRKHNRDGDGSRREHRREKDRRHSPSGNDGVESQIIRRSKKHHRKDHESRQHSASDSDEDEPRESRHRHSMKHHRSSKDHKPRRRSDTGSDREEPQDSQRSRRHHRREDRESRRRSDSGSGRVEPRDSRRSRKHHGSEDRESRRRSPSRDKDHSDRRDSRLKFASVDEAKELIAELERTRRNQRDCEGSDNGKRSHAHRGNHAESKRPKRRRRNSRVYSDDSDTDGSSRHGRHRRKGSDHKC